MIFLIYTLRDRSFNIVKLKDSPSVSRFKTNHIDCTTSMAVDKNKKFLISREGQNIILTDFQNKNQICRFENDDFFDSIEKIVIKSDSKYLIASSRNGSVIVWDLEELKLYHKFENLHTRRVSMLADLPESGIVISASNDRSLAVIDIADKKVLFSLPELQSKPFDVLAATKIRGVNYILIGGDDSEEGKKCITIWKLQDNKLFAVRKLIDPYDCLTEALLVNSNTELIVSADRQSICIWKFGQTETESPQLINSIVEYQEFINDINISDNGRYLAVMSSRRIQIWDMSSNKRVFCLKENVFKDLKYGNVPKGIVLDSKQLVYSDYNTLCFVDCSFWIGDPDIQNDRIQIFPAIEYFLNSEKYAPEEISKHIQALGSCYYLPKSWNFLNFVSLILPTVDKSVFDIARANNVTLSFDNEGRTQLDYLLDNTEGHGTKTKQLYVYFFEKISLLLNINTPDQDKLLKSLTEQIEKIYNTQTETSFLNFLSCFLLDPKIYLKNSEKLPIQGDIRKDGDRGYVQLPSLSYDKKEVEKTVIEGNMTLNYSLLALPSSYDIFSEDSFKLIGLLNNSDNVSFYESPVVRTTIDFYWEKSKPYLWYLLLFNLIPIVLFTIFALTRTDHIEVASGMLMGVVAFTSLFIFAEILQMITDFGEYAENPFNFIELVILSVQIVTAVFFWVNTTPTALSFFVSLSTILWYFKLLILLRVIDQLRQLIRMIIQIASDIKSFLTVIFAMMVAFTIAMYQSRNAADPGDTTFWSVALEMYTFGIGSYDDTNYSGVTMPFFILATLLMPLVLLNMLIAIMGDSYGRAKDDAVSIDAKERVAMISEISSTAIQVKKIASFLTRRSLKEPQKFYVMTVEPYEAQEAKDSVEDLISEQNTKIQAVKDEMQSNMIDIKKEIQMNGRSVQLALEKDIQTNVRSVQIALEKDIQTINQNMQIILEKLNKASFTS